MIGSADHADIDFLIYIDASYEAELDTGGLGAIVIDRLNFISSANRVGAISESIASRASMGQFPHSSIIFGLEMAAACWVIFSMCGGVGGGRLRGRDLLIFVDNNAALCCFARAASAVKTAGRYVAALWWLFTFSDARVWFGRVTSNDNPADIPSRGHPFDLFEADRYCKFPCDDEWYELADSVDNSKVAPPLHSFPL